MVLAPKMARRWSMIAAVALLPLTAACAASDGNTDSSAAPTKTGAAVVLTEKQAGNTVTVGVGTPFTVQLDGNGGTGYAWELTPTPDIEQVSDNQRAHTPGLPGGLYTHSFVLNAARAGTYKLEFRHHQPWNKTAPDVKIVQFSVVAR